MFVGFQGTVVIDRERRNKNEQTNKLKRREEMKKRKKRKKKMDGEKKKYKQENINGLYSIDFVILISIVVIMCN